MSRDVLIVSSTMRIPLLYRGEYSQWSKRFMNYLEEQTDGETMINCIKYGDQLLPRVTQVSIAGTSSTEQPHLKDKSMWSDQEKKIQKIDRLARSLLIQGLSIDIYSLIDSNKTAKDLWDALARHMLGSEYGEQDRKAVQNQRDVNDAIGLKEKIGVVTSDPLALIAEKTKVSKRKEKVVVSSDSKGSDADDFSELKKIITLLAKAFIKESFILNQQTTTREHHPLLSLSTRNKTVDHNDSEGIDKLAKEFNKKIAKCLKRIEKANQQNKDFENQNKDLQDKYDV
nr:hypothetical protein [Tanacetum cinerariifolium]